MSNIVPLRKPPIPRAALPGPLAGTTDSRIVETIKLRPIRPGLASIDLRVRGFHLRNLIASRNQDGTVRVRPPRIVSRNGTDFGCAYGLPPEMVAPIQAAIRVVWDRIDAAAEAGNGR